MIGRLGLVRWRRRRAERQAAAELVGAAILEIRMFAASPHLYEGPGTAAEHIHDIADAVHNLAGGIIGGGEGQRAWDGPGYHTFLWMWQTASDRQRRWLVAEFSAMGYDYSYLESSPTLPLPATAPATRLSVRLGGWRVPHDVGLVKAVDTDAYAALMIEVHDRGLSSGKRGDWLIAHLDPKAVHILIPCRPDDVFFGPKQDGVWQYRSLLRMNNGETVVGSLRTHTTRYAAVPSTLPKREQVRLAALPTGRDRDVYLWSRDHREQVPDCPACDSATAPVIPATTQP